MEFSDSSSMQRNLEVLAIQFGRDPKEQSVSSMMKKVLASKGSAPSGYSKERFRLLLGGVDEEDRTRFLKLYRQLMLSSATTTTAVVDFLAELLRPEAKLETKSAIAKGNSSKKEKEIVSLGKVAHHAKSKNSKPTAAIPTEPEGGSNVVAKNILKAGKLDFRTDLRLQQQIVSDLLYCLQGVNGKSVLCKFSGESDSKEDFVINSSCDAGLRNFIETFFPVCMDVRRLSDFVERHLNAGIVHSEISMSIRKFLREHLVHGVEWRRLLSSKQLTYQSLWLYVQSTRKVFRCLRQLCELIDKECTRGGATLELIEKSASAYDGDSVVMPIVTHVQMMAGNAYFEFLNDWLRTGEIDDPYGEFMINVGEAASVALRTGSMEEVFSSMSSIKVNEQMCPSFLHPLVDQIREAGIFVQILLSSGYWDHNKRYSKIEYTLRSGMCVAQIENMCKEISRAFVQYLMEKFDLVSQIASIRYVYFLCRGDWLIDFIDIAEDELSSPLEKVHVDRLQILFNCAIESSSIRHRAFLKDIKPCLRTTRIQNIIRYVSLQLYLGKKFDRVAKNMHLYEAFSIRYEPHWPLSMLFTPVLTTHFEILFRWLMLFKYVDRQLSKTWMLNSDITFALFKRMFDVVFDVLNLMTTSVIDPLWKELLVSVKTKELTFDELKGRLNDAVTSCLDKCFACDESLTETIVHLLSSCLRFQNTLMESQEVDHALIQKLDDEFKDALSELKSRLPAENDPAYFSSFTPDNKTVQLD
ncbi:hypothetical protein M514_05510 [Trichuris suis]|uniref:Gamma-tubulin complex component n=1 Tax=Trichuris suis TaxID=68888 RepID=A0A085N020_9BILA|nr:hypothetical protein M514_05510 [Trichuris suis]